MYYVQFASILLLMATDQRADNDTFIPVTPLPLHTAIMSEYSSVLSHRLSQTHSSGLSSHTHSNKAWLNVALHHVCHHTGPRFLLLAQCATLESSKEPSQNKQCQQNATWSSHTFRTITAVENFTCFITLTPVMLFLHRHLFHWLMKQLAE